MTRALLPDWLFVSAWHRLMKDMNRDEHPALQRIGDLPMAGIAIASRRGAALARRAGCFSPRPRRHPPRSPKPTCCDVARSRIPAADATHPASQPRLLRRPRCAREFFEFVVGASWRSRAGVSPTRADPARRPAGTATARRATSARAVLPDARARPSPTPCAPVLRERFETASRAVSLAERSAACGSSTAGARRDRAADVHLADARRPRLEPAAGERGGRTTRHFRARTSGRGRSAARRLASPSPSRDGRAGRSSAPPRSARDGDRRMQGSHLPLDELEDAGDGRSDIAGNRRQQVHWAGDRRRAGRHDGSVTFVCSASTRASTCDGRRPTSAAARRGSCVRDSRADDESPTSAGAGAWSDDAPLPSRRARTVRTAR